MKLRLGTSILLLLQARAPTTAFSSPLSSKRVRSASSPISFILRGGSSNNHHNKNNDFKATISPEETSSQQIPECDQDVKEQITKAAFGSIDITGPSTHVDCFAGISFVNTSKLNSSSSSSSKQHRVLFVLGGPGAGKGTQSENIVSEYKCIHLSVGELLREERLRGDESPHAELIEQCLVAGKIVPVEISLNLVRNAMDKAVSGSSGREENVKHYGQPIFLVDGFPRNYDNLSGWTMNMPNFATCIGSLVYDCSMDVLEKRILSRAETSGRSDDNLESARKRFKTFQQQTMPVVYALEEVEKMQIVNDKTDIGKLHIQHINGVGTVDQVWDATKDAMNLYIQNDILSANTLLLHAIESQDVETYASLTCIEMLSLSKDQDDIDAGDIDVNFIGEDKVDMVKVKEAFSLYEVIDGCSDGTVNHISNAQIDIMTGTKAVVSYDRKIEDKSSGEIKSQFRETRVWSHESKGWVCIHFVRKPLSDQ